MDSENIQNNDKIAGKSLRLHRPSIVVLCGPAACGKSTFAEKHFRPTQIISSDWARARVCDDDRDQRFNAQAFSLVHFLIEERLILNRLCVVDSTALTVQARKDLLELAKKYQIPTTLIAFNVPLETCVERDEKRERTVGRAVIERQYQAYDQTKSTVALEGFGQVVELQQGEMDTVQIEILFRPTVRTAQRAPRPNGSGPQRSQRPPQFSPPRPTGSGGNGHSRPAPGVQRAAAQVAAPQPTLVPGGALPMASASPQTVEPPVAPPKPTAAVQPPEVSAGAKRRGDLAPTAPPLRPVRPAPALTVPVGVPSPGSR
jgi:predicted kinase